jgi:hypothetical protein
VVSVTIKASYLLFIKIYKLELERPYPVGGGGGGGDDVECGGLCSN